MEATLGLSPSGPQGPCRFESDLRYKERGFATFRLSIKKKSSVCFRSIKVMHDTLNKTKSAQSEKIDVEPP